jgi:glyoxylase-like metal-dependent hydrolase (beta-lactamase superfamily II)
VAPGVFAVLQPTARRFNESNSVFVVRQDGVLVVETQSSLAATAAVIREIRARTELPVRQLVLTHWHGDHVQGISAYREAWPEVEVIGHSSLVEDIRSRAEPQADEEIGRYEEAIAAAKERLRDQVDREGNPLSKDDRAILASQIEAAEATAAGKRAVPRPFAVPDSAYDGELVLGTGPGTVRIRHYRAHTRGDSLLFLPDSGVLITGDVLDDLPFGGHGYPASWVAALEELAALEVRVIVPGHGQVRQGKDHLPWVLEMFRSLVDQVSSSVARDLDLEATQETVDLAGYRDQLAGNDAIAGRAWDNFIPPTIERAWLEARGELPD